MGYGTDVSKCQVPIVILFACRSVCPLHLGREYDWNNIGTVVAILGYPLYFIYIIGIAKMLGAIAIVVPHFPRLKEWAYAGIVFNMTGAFVSWLVVTVMNGVPIPAGYGSPMFHVINALHLIVLTVVSWALRPESRVLVNREVE
jgi:uncharacterized membrane protein YphA (DoxX/SURF4 family)